MKINHTISEYRSGHLQGNTQKNYCKIIISIGIRHYKAQNRINRFHDE